MEDFWGAFTIFVESFSTNFIDNCIRKTFRICIFFNSPGMYREFFIVSWNRRKVEKVSRIKDSCLFVNYRNLELSGPRGRKIIWERFECIFFFAKNFWQNFHMIWTFLHRWNFKQFLVLETWHWIRESIAFYGKLYLWHAQTKHTPSRSSCADRITRTATMLSSY